MIRSGRPRRAARRRGRGSVPPAGDRNLRLPDGRKARRPDRVALRRQEQEPLAPDLPVRHPGHVELTYPAPGETPAFRHAVVSYSGLGGYAVLFARGPVTYALFYVLGHDTEFDGVAVGKGEAEVANLSCAPGSLDALTTDFFKGAGLPRESTPFEVPEVFFKRYEMRGR